MFAMRIVTLKFLGIAFWVVNWLFAARLCVWHQSKEP